VPILYGQRQCLVNAVTVHVGPGTNMSGKATNQDLASQNVPTSLLTQNNFRFVRNPFKIDATRGDHFPQAEFSVLKL